MPNAPAVIESTIFIDLPSQTLIWEAADGQRIDFQVSTARNGPNCVLGSNGTPTGLHRVRMKLGGDSPLHAVFVGRRATGEVWRPEMNAEWPGREWFLSRLLWLDGLEDGVNRGGKVDTLRRLIYIHGTADEQAIGRPASEGGIRMRNRDIVDLFERVAVGTPVTIGSR